MNNRERWSKSLIAVGYIAMLVGAIDPMEGSLAILPGSALVAIGTFFAPAERQWIAWRMRVFVLIAVGVATMLVASAFGGFGGHSGLSLWWAALVLPYPIGWVLGICGPGNPRWVSRAGIVIGLWYLTIPVLILAKSSRPKFLEVLITVAAIGVVTIAGCIWRLRRTAGKRADGEFSTASEAAAKNRTTD